ncbi:hypothetical protein ACLBYG_22325 [Methylobacterium sp. D53M]
MDATARAGDFCSGDDACGDQGEPSSTWSLEPEAVTQAVRGLAGSDPAAIKLAVQIYTLGFRDGQSQPSAPSVPSRPPRVKKQDIVADLLRRPQGCMTWEILEATGWPTVNIKRFARAAGLDVRKERVAGNCYRFFGIPADQAARASAA